MIRIAVQSKGRLYEDTMALLAEADIKLSTSKRTLLTQAIFRWKFSSSATMTFPKA
mgnify:CR=1 FL=1